MLHRASHSGRAVRQARERPLDSGQQEATEEDAYAANALSYSPLCTSASSLHARTRTMAASVKIALS